MPLFDTSAEPVVKNDVVTVRKQKTAIVDTRYESVRSLLTHIDGSKWVVDYYSQMGGVDEELAHQEINRPAIYQQYLRIKQLELRVTTPLDTAQDDEGKEFTLTGSANLFPGVIANVGDMFHASLSDGRGALFTVTAAKQMTILRDSTYQIDYTLVNYDNDVLLGDLLRKISKDTTFVREFYALNKSPMLVDSELSNFQEIQQWLKTLPTMYFDLFFDRNFSTLLVPGQEKTTYDPFVVEFVRKIVSTDTHPNYKNIKVLNYDQGDAAIKTVYDAIYDQNEDLLDYAPLKMLVAPASEFSIRARLNSLRYSGINFCVYPIVNAGGLAGVLQPSSDRVYNRPFDIQRFFTSDLDVGADLPNSSQLNREPYKKVTTDDYYVLSSAFYESVFDQLSFIESAAILHMAKKPVSIPLLLALAKSATYWTRLEQFYYVPLLMLFLGRSLQDIN
jgi:hypothetical protein